MRGAKIDSAPATANDIMEQGATGGRDSTSKSFKLKHKPKVKPLLPAELDECTSVPGELPSLGAARAGRSHSCDLQRGERISQQAGHSDGDSSTNSNDDNNASHGSPVRSMSTSSDSAMETKKTVWKSINGASTEISRETRRVLGFFKRKWHSRRGKRETAVKEIHIAPEEDEERWACRSVSEGSSSGNNSRASSSTTYYSNSRESTNVQVVHDMQDEYNPEYR